MPETQHHEISAFYRNEENGNNGAKAEHQKLPQLENEKKEENFHPSLI